MAASSPRPGGAIVGINVTPLVDITLVLLIIFMVTAKLIVNDKAMLVDLPKAASGETVQTIFSVTLTATGATLVDGTPVAADDAFIARARSARAGDRDVHAVIAADGTVPHARVMHALDLLRQASISHVGFAVVPVAEPRRP